MIKLEENNIVKYLESIVSLQNWDFSEAQAQEIKENTNVNYVFQVTLRDNSKIYLKQAFDYVKIKPDFPAPLDRQYYEKLSIEYLQRFWKDRIPEVIHYDKENNILIITDVGEGAKLLVDEIKQGNLHLDAGEDLGNMMAMLHHPTYGKDDYPVREKEANEEHIKFIFGFRLRGARETLPNETEKLFQDSLKVKTSMIYGDWASKNVFVKGKNIKLVDFENLVRFDPAFDIGYALAHWVLEISEENRLDIVKFLRDFQNSYSKTMKEDIKEIMERATRYIGGMMLHRLAGVKNTNRLDEYLSREIPLIEISKRVMVGGYKTPSEAIEEVSIK
jgi:5-methylthioribose kinase